MLVFFAQGGGEPVPPVGDCVPVCVCVGKANMLGRLYVCAGEDV